MASRRVQRKTCRRKVSYTLDHARRILRKIPNPGGILTVYKCPFTPVHYHLGHGHRHTVVMVKV